MPQKVQVYKHTFEESEECWRSPNVENAAADNLRRIVSKQEFSLCWKWKSKTIFHSNSTDRAFSTNYINQKVKHRCTKTEKTNLNCINTVRITCTAHVTMISPHAAKLSSNFRPNQVLVYHISNYVFWSY